MLLGAAIKPEVIDASGIESTKGGMNFPWWDGNGTRLTQYRPDTPITTDTGQTIKYVFPKGSSMILNQLRDPGYGPVLICEGTKQQYAALSWAPDSFAVYGMAGCWCWTDADLMPFMGRDVFIVFDGDFVSNRDVYDAAKEFKDALMAHDAASVKFVKTTARDKDGLDDVLSRMPEDKRTHFMTLWISRAIEKLPKAPAKKDANPFFEKGSLLVQKATEFLLERQPAALTQEHKIAVYLNGSYHINGTAFVSAVGRMLGDQYRPNWRAAMEEMTEGILFESAKILPDRNAHQLLNCSNGMLDLRTLELLPHDPSYLSCVQVPVAWDPDASAPVYEAWLEDVCGSQAADLEEVAATMLDPTRTPHKAAFLFGPSRSGKSTFLRIMQSMAGVENRTAVTLHELSTSPFAAANVYGKILNSAADLSSSHVADLSVFKMMTGEDPVHGNRKYGRQFTFTNGALFAFSANELPTVSESSRAYAERIKPFEFPNSFAGRENPEIESTMLSSELPGILVRWVTAYRRILERGGYSVTDARVRQEFDTRSDRVAQWVAESCAITPYAEGQIVPATECTGRRETASEFNRWAQRNGGHTMGERKVFDRLRQIEGIYEVRVAVVKSRAFNIVVRNADDADLAFRPNQDPRGAEGAESNPSSPYVMKSNSNVEVHGENGFQSAPSAPVAFDLETCSAADLHKRSDFVRLVGWSGTSAPTVSTSAPELLGALTSATAITGHNILGFDLLALAKHHGADYEALAAKAVDTMLIAKQLDPPSSKGMPAGYYSLDSLCEQYGVARKTDDIKRLAKKHGGFDRIPLDDAEYSEYLRGDVAASQALAGAMGQPDPYVQREHRVQAIMGRISLSGFRVDEELCWDRHQRGVDKQDEIKDRLHREHAFPVEGAAPQRTNAGKEAFYNALRASGLGPQWLEQNWPRNKDGSLSLAKEVLTEKVELLRGPRPQAADICEAILAMNGVRSVYGNCIDWTVNGRVHPEIHPEQASGRWSVTKPGLTVMGKRGGKHVEREIYLPEPGEVIVAFDLDQVDMRALAAHSQDRGYMSLFEPGKDAHTEMAAMVGLPREESKRNSHGWNYGLGIDGQVRNGVQREVAVQFDSMMREKFPRLIEWQNEVRAIASAGELLDNGYGRKLRVHPDWAYTQAPAQMGQGTTRDILAEGLLRLPKEIIPMLRVVVHDEIVLSIPADSLDDVSRAVQDALTFEFKGVPITCGASKAGDSWGACYSK